MPFDGITLSGVCQELNRELAGSRIYKIYQPEKDEICLVIRKADHTSVNLVISANPTLARIHLAAQRKENPKQAPAFCMLLRKYLEGAKIQAVTQEGLERILTLHINALNDFHEWEPKHLIFELMGKHSNILLLHPQDGIIIDAIKRYTLEVNAYRQVFPGSPYTAPPAQDKLDPASMTVEEFSLRLYSLEPPVTLASGILALVSGYSLTAARELCLQCGIDPKSPTDICGEYELSRLWSQLKHRLAAAPHGYVLRKDQTAQDFSAYPFYNSNASVEVYDTVNQACEIYFSEKIKNERLQAAKSGVTRPVKHQLDRAYKKLFLQNGDQRKSQENKKYKIWGEVLTAYAHQFQKGDLQAELTDFYTGEALTIELDPRYTPIENAQRFFRIYQKSQAALRHLASLTQATQTEINYLESVLLSLTQSESVEEIALIREELTEQGYLKSSGSLRKTKLLKLPPRRFISGDGYNILIGRNNQQNDWLTLKAADKYDLWLHTQNIPGSHVIIDLPQGTGKIDEIPDRTLEEAARLAVYYSKARTASKVPVDYTFRINVKKPPGAKPGMVVYDPYWTILTDPFPVLTETETIQEILT